MKGAGELAVMVQEVLMILRYFEGLNHIIPDCHMGEYLSNVMINLPCAYGLSLA